MTEAWVTDDPDIPGDEILLRRVKRVPTCVVPNVITKRYELQGNALRFDVGSGMSCHSDRLLAEESVSRREVCDWSTHTAIEFEADVPRSVGGGVVLEVEPDDEVLGHAHALVRGSSPDPPRDEKKRLRTAIADAARVMPEDPRVITGEVVGVDG